MKFKIRNIKKVVFVMALATLGNSLQADLGKCIKDAKCRETLAKNLKEGGYEAVATAFEGVTTQNEALNAIKQLSVALKIKVIAAAKAHQEHLEKILAADVEAAKQKQAAAAA